MNKKGSVLLMTIILMVVLMIFGTVVLMISGSNTKQVSHQEKVLKAYYLARAGASSVADFIVNNVGMTDEQMKTYVANNLIGQTSSTQTFGDGTFSVKVEYADPVSNDINILKVTGTGVVDGVSQEESVYISSYMYLDKAIYANDFITASQQSLVNGDVHANNTVTLSNKAEINGTVEYLPYLVLPQIDPFPDLGNAINDVVVFFSDDPLTGDKVFENIYYNKYFPTLRIKSSLSNATTEVKFNLTEDRDYFIKVDYLDVDNVNIVVENYNSNARLFIFVNDLVEWLGSVTADPSSFYLIVGQAGTDSEVIMKTGSSKFQGYLYAPESEVLIKANLELEGAIVCDTISLESGGTVDYVSNDPLFSPSMLGIPPDNYRVIFWGKP